MKKLYGTLAIVLLCIACNGEGDYTYEMIREETHSWSSVGIVRVDVDDVNGDIDVTARQDTTITLDVTKRCFGEDSVDAEEHITNIEITTQITSGELAVEADMPTDQERSYSASLDFRMPDSLYMYLLTINGSITVRNMRNGASIYTTNGALSVQNFEGSINGETLNGNIVCDMNALTSSEGIDLLSENGDITTDVPSTVTATFDLSNNNGNITISGFTNVVYTTNQPNHKAGTINGGGATIDIYTNNGNIDLNGK
jgi:DUF4097 and DUF4098 domain-containing protein YvlB